MININCKKIRYKYIFDKHVHYMKILIYIFYLKVIFTKCFVYKKQIQLKRKY